jgi:geranylgeranyl transferase type-2 subunit alpha
MARDIWKAELGLVSKMLTKDQRNFHAWSYRRKVVAKLESDELQGSSMVESEFEYTTKMIERDLSNFSAWHNRSQLVLRILEERAADDQGRTDFLDQELDLSRRGLNVGPEDQSLWYYHQFLMSHLLDDGGRPTMAPNLTQEERIARVHREIEEIRDLAEDYDDVKWIYEALLEYSSALEKWKRVHSIPSGDQASRDERIAWLTKLKELDPLRNGRWSDVEQSL